jgi:peptidyl-prolyl cis-trans isomerase SurA
MLRFPMSRMRMPIFGALSLACLLFGAMPASALNEQRIAAIVNDEVVSVRDLNERLDLVMLTSGIPDSQDARDRLAPQVLRGLIEESLQLQEAARLSINVDQSEIDRALDTIAQRNRMSVDQLRGLLTSRGINFETLVRQVRAQLAWVKVVNRTIRPTVNVTVDQLDLAVQEARADQGQPEYQLSEIVLPVDNPSQLDRVAQDAARLVQTLREGASFDSLARQVSVAASAAQGGDLGWVGASSIPPPLLDTLDRMRPGEITDPIVSPVGYHIFWLRGRRTSQAPAASSQAAVEVSLAQILFPTNGATDDATLTRLREQAAGLRDRLSDCAAMATVAEELKAPQSGDLGWLKISDLPPEIGQTALTLPVGQVSAPLNGPGGIHLLMVCDRREPAGGEAPDRQKIADRLQRERLDLAARRYLRDLRKQAFVEVRTTG